MEAILLLALIIFLLYAAIPVKGYKTGAYCARCEYRCKDYWIGSNNQKLNIRRNWCGKDFELMDTGDNNCLEGERHEFLENERCKYYKFDYGYEPQNKGKYKNLYVKNEKYKIDVSKIKIPKLHAKD
jgi:hypothetical protein